MCRVVEYQVLFRFASTEISCPLCLREEIIRTMNRDRSTRFTPQELNKSFNGLRSPFELPIFYGPQIDRVVNTYQQQAIGHEMRAPNAVRQGKQSHSDDKRTTHRCKIVMPTGDRAHVGQKAVRQQ